MSDVFYTLYCTLYTFILYSKLCNPHRPCTLYAKPKLGLYTFPRKSYCVLQTAHHTARLAEKNSCILLQKEVGPMRGLETDHVISGPMRGLKINFIGKGHHSTFNIHSTYKHCDSMTEPAQRTESVKTQ